MSHSPQTLSGSVIAAENMMYQGRRTQTAIAKEPSQIRALQVLMLASALLVLPATFVVPIQLVLPTVSILALALAGMLCATAWSMNVGKGHANLSLWDIAGLLAFIGFGSGMLSNAEAVPQLLDFSPRRQ